MASHRYLLTLSLVSYLLFFTSLTPTCSASLSLASPPDSSSKVSLGLYYETLCPYSADFIINYLVQIFDTGLISILDLNLVPWGNARILANNTFNCQHGPLECLLNTVEACAISVWSDLNKHFPFIYCVETLVYEHQYTQWETCFEKLDLDPTPITECYSSGYGKEDFTPNQLQNALCKTFSVKKKKGKLRKAWDGSKVIYNVASWGATAIGIYQNPALLSAASTAFWTSCQVISKLF